ncbi:MAG TPA: hypothetical protein P5060_02000 [Candidatus Absconditabacterales bacterium]|nr:hypothetical protein [Candidatus Absconditabacterales bacterium]
MVNTANITEENKLSLDNIKKNPDQISQLSDEDLKSFFDQEKDTDDYDLISSLSKELGSRKQKEEIQEDPELQKKLAEDQLKQEESNAEEQKKMQEESEITKEVELDHVEELKKKLEAKEEDNQTLEKWIQDLEKKLDDKNKENSSKLEELKEAQKSGDKQELKRLRGVIKKLALEKKALKDTYAGELPKYDASKIKKLKTRWIGFKLFSKRQIDGQTVISGPQLMFRNNIRSRRRLNKTVKMFNKIGNDPKKAIRYILSKSITGQIGMGVKKLNNRFTIRDTDKFDEVFNKQKKKFIENLESKMEKKSMSEVDKKTLQAIKDRIDYYQKAYKRKMITV